MIEPSGKAGDDVMPGSPATFSRTVRTAKADTDRQIAFGVVLAPCTAADTQ